MKVPNYSYEVVNASGKKINGLIRSASKHTAISELQDRSFNVRSVQEKQASWLDMELRFGRAVKLQHFVIFCRQFATLIRSGVQMDAALALLEGQTSSKKLRAALVDITDQVRNGRQLSKAMEAHEAVFPKMFVNMIHSGEMGGSLDQVLDRMAVHYEKEQKTIQKVKSAMTYPGVVLIVAFLVVIFLLVKVVPTFTDMFKDQGAELPWVTKVVVGASGWVSYYWWMGLLLIIFLPIVIRILIQKESVQYFIDKWKLRIPLVGKMLRNVIIARLIRTLSELSISAVPLLQALEITEKVVGNLLYVAVLKDTRASLEEGKLLSVPMRNSGLFPTMVIQMLIVGEETGQVDTMLIKIAEFIESEVEQSVDRMKALIEPILMLFVSAIVGFIVTAIMSPMFKLYQNFLH
jgi:type IV pilus assembly protein PilC